MARRTACLAAFLAATSLAFLPGCSQTQITAAAASPEGQLFCGLQTAGGALVAGLVDAEATAANPLAGQAAVIATGALKSQVDAECAAAGGVPVSPPANPAAAPQVAIVVSKALSAAPVSPASP